VLQRLARLAHLLAGLLAPQRLRRQQQAGRTLRRARGEEVAEEPESALPSTLFGADSPSRWLSEVIEELAPGVPTAPLRRKASPRLVTFLASRYLSHTLMLSISIAVVLSGGLRDWIVSAQPHGPVGGDIHGATDDLNGDDLRNIGPQGGFITLPQPQTQEVARIVRYKAEAGDTPLSVAQKFGLEVQTILWANQIYDQDQAFDQGQDVIVPPIDGMYHVVKEGETVESIARMYRADPQAIINFFPNDVPPDGTLRPGQEIVVPGGRMPPRQQTLTYKVRPGETLSYIAHKFGISTSTLIWANNISDPNKLSVGQELVILPITGIVHKVKEGETLDSIAAYYGVLPKAILDYAPNGIPPSGELRVGQEITVPDGAMPTPTPIPRPTPRPAPAAPQIAPLTGPRPSGQPGIRGRGNFIWPVGGIITQYFSSYHSGLDIAAPMGTPLHAADAGRVTYATWSPYGYGNFVIVDHGNGFVTRYGHLSAFAVQAGDWVNQGDVIGYIGSTGRSTGPHVHFEVLLNGVFQNPLGYLP
jgi:murein DD-endopeptidase MepM/ murein hydrolase activator NlpD